MPHAGIGELRLLLPALTTLAESRWLAWINPPFTPYAPALEAAGIDSNKILLIYTKTHEEMLWAMERTCKSGSCGAVLVWPDERKLSLKETRRVQLAAKQGATLSVLFRPMEASSKASLAELRLVLSPDKESTTFICKYYKTPRRLACQRLGSASSSCHTKPIHQRPYR